MAGWISIVSARLKALLADTLFKRLFVLMWLALVVSHAVAWLVVTRNVGPSMGAHMPTFPSLPPMAFGHDAGPPAAAGAGRRPPAPPDEAPPGWQDVGRPQDRFGRPPGAGDFDGRGGPDAGQRPGGPRVAMPTGTTPGSEAARPSFGLSTSLAVLDYGIRLLIIGAAAWLGARWLSAPMRRLQQASRALGRSLARNEAPPRVDERTGTVEVRETAQVFNDMARQLGEQANARSLLVAAISHDLRTPLTRIRMRLEGSAADLLTARSIADIHEMDDLIESALEVFRGAGGNDEPAETTDVHALVQAIVDDLADLGQPVSVRGEPSPARVRTKALRRVIANLVNNALRYGKTASVTVQPQRDAVHIVIEDEGPGIPEAQLEAVMKPFYRLESSRNRLTGGSGLGLYIARDLLARQDGTLTLANRPEGGLRATITLKV